ncbi:MAG: hypothetical protein QXQ82_02175 [Candidatus Pacearchaeota archaeon]
MKTTLIIFFILASLLFLFFSTFVHSERALSSSSFLLEKPSPSDKINESNIQVFQDKIIIYIGNATIVSYTDTNSMDPTMDKEANGIEVKPSSPEEIHVGDIISFKKGNEIVSHRVIKIGKDEKGWYCETKGDNTVFSDGKVRFEQIVGVVVGIIY